MRLITDVTEYSYREVPKWNPMNVCSYHLQEAGATPVQELAFALATAIAVLDQVARPGPGRKTSPRWSAASSFFVNAGIRFVTEMCKMRAFVRPLGRDHPRPLRHARREAPPLPLWRPGQLASASPSRSRRTTSTAS